ncbi:MAG: FixH family protein [Bacteroidia bacterium]|jgi:hypothetical protein|nr:FixH family protein [Bacteroidia bacterium]
MNWGTRIALVYGTFVVLIVSMVFASTRERWQLVTDEYYSEELKYEERIERMRQAQALPSPLKVSYRRADQVIVVAYPGPATGTIHLYRPSDAGSDQVHTIAPVDGHQEISTAGLLPGLWRVQVTWDHDGVGYYAETVLNL